MADYEVRRITFDSDGDSDIAESLKKPFESYKKQQKLKTEEAISQKVSALEKMLNIIVGSGGGKAKNYLPVIKEGYSKEYDQCLKEYEKQSKNYDNVVAKKEEWSKEDSITKKAALEKELDKIYAPYSKAMDDIVKARRTLVLKIRDDLNSINKKADIGKTLKDRGKQLRTELRNFIFETLDPSKSEVYKLLAPVFKSKKPPKDGF